MTTADGDDKASPLAPRPRGRPKTHPPGTTNAERVALSRAARDVGNIELPRETLDTLDAIKTTTGEPDRASVVRRLVAGEHSKIAGAKRKTPAPA